MEPSSELFQEWREADRATLQMELEFAQVCMQQMPGDPPEPWQEGRWKLHEMRKRANELFVLAMADMSARADRASACRRGCASK